MTVNYDLDFSYQIVTFITLIIEWCTIGIFAYRMMKKQAVKPKIWKVLVCVLVGVFSFSINLPPIGETPIKIAILPLGVWILYAFLKRKEGRWQSYRPFAWLGFFANFIFLAAALLSVPVQHSIYPENELSTYISTLRTLR